jgi:beta-glucosidase
MVIKTSIGFTTSTTTISTTLTPKYEMPLQKIVMIRSILFLSYSMLSSISALALQTNGCKNIVRLRKPLPDKILVAYTSNHCKDLNYMDKVTKAIQDGVNVLIWVFIAFDPVENVTSDSARLKMKANLDVLNYQSYRRKLADMGYSDVAHLVAFGGWNGPHLPAGYSSQELYEAFKTYNTQGQTTELLFDGVDWDLEGHNDLDSPTNEFTKECLDQMGEFSQLAKDDGCIVSMAPPESYLDITSSRFSRFVNLTYPEPWHQDFEYHGWNVYAYVLAKWNDAIDFVFVQFYESYSHAAHQIFELGVDPADFLISYVHQLVDQEEGLTVQFNVDSSINLKSQFVPLPLSKLVLGFANGWALNNDLGEKTVYFEREQLQKAYRALIITGNEPRGMGFWVVEEEGNHGVHYAQDLNDVLHMQLEGILVENKKMKAEK